MAETQGYQEERWQEGLRHSLLAAITHNYPTQLGNMQFCLNAARQLIRKDNRQGAMIYIRDAIAYFEKGDTEARRAELRKEQEEEKIPAYDSPSIISLFNDPSWIAADIANSCAVARQNPGSLTSAELIPTEEQLRQTSELQSGFVAAYIEPFQALYEALKAAMHHVQSLSETDSTILIAEVLKKAFDCAEKLREAFNQMPTKEARAAALKQKIPLEQIAAVCRARFGELTRGA